MLRAQPLLHKYYTAQHWCAKYNIRRLLPATTQLSGVFFPQQGVVQGLDVVYWANQQFVATVIRVPVP